MNFQFRRLRVHFPLLLLLAVQALGLSAPSDIQPKEVRSTKAWPCTLNSGSYAAWAKLGRKGKYTESEPERLYKEGENRLKADDYDGAIDAFLQATYFARNGYYPDAFHWLGISYMNKGTEDAKAIDALEKAVSQAVEEDTSALIAIAEIHLRHDRYEDVDKTIDRIHKYDDKTRQSVQYLYGRVEDQRGHYTNAESHYRQALGDKPWTWTKVWVYYAEAKMKQKKWKDAYLEFKDMENCGYILKGLQEDRVNLDMGVCKLAIGDHQGALDHWNRALDYNRKNAEVWLQRGMLLESEQHLSSALKNYQEFVRLMQGTNDPRVQQLKDRITKLEHQLKPNETAPQIVPPSPYMRQQMQMRNEQEESIRQQQRRPTPSGESGF